LITIGNGELCPFCKKVVVTEQNGFEHLKKCMMELSKK